MVSVEVSVEADDSQVCNFASPACLKEQRGRKEDRLREKNSRALNSKARGTRNNGKSVEIKWTKVKKMWRGGGES